MRRTLVGSWLLAAAATIGLGLALWPRSNAPSGARAASSSAPEDPDDSPAGDDGDDVLAFRVPTGSPAALSCDQAKQVLSQVTVDMLAYAPESPSPSALSSGASDWLDPYGLWSVAPDSPVGKALDSRAPALLAELEGSRAACPDAVAVGKDLVAWVAELDRELRLGRQEATRGDRLAFAEPFTEIARDDEPARELARELGRKLGQAEAALGARAKPYADAAARRYVPSLSAEQWGDVVLAAAVRAYVPLVDPHGAWAPDGEESSVYDVDLESKPPARAWTKASRTVLGVRIDQGAEAPLADGDVVLEIDGLPTGGLPPEQVEQLAFHCSTPDVSVVRVRAGGVAIERVTMAAAPSNAAPAGKGDVELAVTRVPYGEGDVAIVAIDDVPDDLGKRFESALRSALGGPRAATGVVIDLRGNGGGSTEGAMDVLGQLVPGAPLFPMKRRDGSLETNRAPRDASPPYAGPLATLVDAGTASAAEMIAGALGAYHRAPILGTPTYGKGCAQEYADDATQTGVLRLTTLLYALPDGSAVQRVGLEPWARVPFLAKDLGPSERESTLPHAPPVWSGPDVRDAEIVKRSEVRWPEPRGAIGPCADGKVCSALAMLAKVNRPLDTRRAARGR